MFTLGLPRLQLPLSWLPRVNPPAFIYFAESASELKFLRGDLKLAYKNKIGFWITYATNPNLDPELSRKKVLKRMKKAGMKTRAEEVIDRNWSGLYFSKNKVK